MVSGLGIFARLRFSLRLCIYVGVSCGRGFHRLRTMKARFSGRPPAYSRLRKLEYERNIEFSRLLSWTEPPFLNGANGPPRLCSLLEALTGRCQLLGPITVPGGQISEISPSAWTLTLTTTEPCQASNRRIPGSDEFTRTHFRFGVTRDWTT